MATPSPLKRAIFESGKRQGVIADLAGIHFTRLSKLANGYEEPKPEEKRALARVLRTSQAQLFPADDKVTA